jgi:hypothetical protein
MQLEDTAFEWFEPTLSDHLESATLVPATQAMFRDFDLFEEEIKKVFRDVDETRAAARVIHQIRQTGSAARYYSQFH